MLKFFRKYNTVILVFGGVFLMVAFLLPQAITQFAPNFGNRSVFEIGDTTYDVQQLSEAGQELEVLNRTFQPLLGPGYAQRFLGASDSTHFILLAHAAEQAGLYNTGGRADEILPVLFENAVAQVQFRGPPQEQELEQLALTFQNALSAVRNPEVGREALRRAHAIVRLQDLYNETSTLSKPEIAAYTTRLFDVVRADIGAIAGADYARANFAPPTEDRLVELYERYRDAEPTDNPFGFSYLLDDAVRFEAMVIRRQVIADAVELDPIEVRKYYIQNKDDRRYPEAFSEARARVEDDVRAERVNEIVASVRSAVANVLVEAHARLERAELGRRILTDDWADERPPMSRLAEVANGAAGRFVATAEDPAVVYTYDDQWYTRSDIGQLEGVGRLGMLVSGRRVALSQALFLFPEFEPEFGEIPEVQVGLTTGGLVQRAAADNRGDEGYLRVLDVRRAGPPSSIEDVRDRVRADALALQGYEVLEERQSELRERVLEGNGVVGTLFDTFASGYEVATNATIRYYDATFRRPARRHADGANPAATSLVNTPGFAQDVIERTLSWDPTRPVEQIPLEERTFPLMVPGTQSLAIVVVSGRDPVTIEGMRTLQTAVFGYLASDIIERDPDLAILSSLRDPERLARRLGFRDLDPDDDINPLNTPDDEDADGAS